MGRLDDLEHDSNEDTSAVPVAGVDAPPGLSGRVTAVPPLPTNAITAAREHLREFIHHPKDHNWMNAENPALWEGSID